MRILILIVALSACTTRRSSSSKNEDADAQTGADVPTAPDTGAPSDAEATPDTATPQTEACSLAHPDGACAGADVCVNGECTTPAVRLVTLEIVADEWSGADEPPYGGAGNALADAGESIDLLPTVENTSGTNYLSVSGKLTSSDPRVEVVEGAAVYDDLVAGGSKAPATPFRVKLAPELQNGTVVSLELALEDSKEGAITTLPVRVGVRRGVRLGMGNPFVDDDSVGKSKGDDDSLIEAGESIELVLDLENPGAVDIPITPLEFDQVSTPLADQKVEVRMSSTSASLTVLDLDNPPTFTAEVPAGGSQSSAADFDFIVSTGASGGACLDFALAVLSPSRTLYRFTETRCFQFGAPIGDACTPSQELCNGADDDCDGTVDDACKSTCGDGTTDPWEACDDKNTKGGDGCSADCLVSEGCGNGVVDPGEACDNAIDGSCPTKAECEAKTDCTTAWTHTGVACQQTCTSMPAAGGKCDDGDPCTTGDTCAAGACVGKPLTCTAIPANSCSGSTLTAYTGADGTCKAGKCEYPKTTKVCANKCSQGFCSPKVAGGGVAPILGDFRHFAIAASSPTKAHVVYSGSNDGIRMAEVTVEGPTGTDEGLSYEESVGAFGIGAGLSGGLVEAAYATDTGLLYVGYDSGGSYFDDWQSSSAPTNHRDLTAAWTADGKAHIFLRDANNGKLYRHVEGETWSTTAALSGVTDLTRAVAQGSAAYAAASTNAGLMVLTSTGSGVSNETIPTSTGAGEPAIAVDADSNLYAVYRKGDALVLSSNEGGSWTHQNMLELDSNDGGFALARNSNDTLCIGVANSVTQELAFFLIGKGGAAAYLLDDTFNSGVQQEQYTQLVSAGDTFYFGYLTADGAALGVVLITPDD